MSAPTPTPSTSTDPTSTTPTPTETIDALLEHYLILLDEYTALCATLNTLQASMYQSLARANFAAERGVRYYGRDYYDERMQAGRRLSIQPNSCTGVGSDGLQRESARGDGVKAEVGTEKGVGDAGAAAGLGQGADGRGASSSSSSGIRLAYSFSVGVYPPPGTAKAKSGLGEEEPSTAEKTVPGAGEGNQVDGGTTAPADANSNKSASADNSRQNEDNPQQETQKKEPPQQTTKEKPTNPLRWFGILTPLPLRQAQSHAIKAVEDIIPRLATLSAEMGAVELEVRRARKRRAKTEKAEKAEGRRVLQVEELIEGAGRVDVSV